MTNIRRYYCEGYCYFITNVTFKRAPILLDNYDLLWEAIESVRQKRNFDLVAWVLLPQHFHAMINPPSGDISTVLKHIKLSFVARYLKRYSIKSGRIWQYRFWDHIIRDEEDFWNHLNYIHLNPVKHGLVKRVNDYPHSSISKFKEFYSEDWGVKIEDDIEGDFGE